MNTEIQTVVTFELDGATFASLEKVKTHVENQIGAMIDKVNPRLTPSQALHMLHLITGNHAVLSDLLSITLEPEDGRGADVNIFEYFNED